MLLQQLISGYINSKHGWAVAEQFESTFSNIKDFEQQNGNALRFILESINELLCTDFFSDDAYDEIQDYKEDLTNYLIDVYNAPLI
jgi:hypothetical protein